MQEWVDVLEKDANVWDQNAFNDLFRRASQPLPDRADRLFQCAVVAAGGARMDGWEAAALGGCAGQVLLSA